jgi:hypothetical protein
MRNVPEIMSIWKTSLKDLGTQKYTKGNRSEILNSLIEKFLENNIDFDTAKSAKKQVIDILITEEGKKGKGNHKTWAVNIADEFIAQLDESYPTSPINPNNYTVNPEFLFSWMSEKWKEPEVANQLKNEFYKEILLSNWFKTGENAPEWASSFYREKESIIVESISAPEQYQESTENKQESDDDNEDWCF